jgi:hypothetical protein
VKDFDVNKAVQWAQLAVLLVGLAVSAATCDRAFNKIADHEKRIGDIENGNKVAAVAAVASDKELTDKLQKIQSAVDFMNWRMDGVTKQLEKAEKKR